MTAPISYCKAPDCFRPAQGDLCWAHRRRRERKREETAEVRDKRSPWQRFVDAMIEFADSPDDPREYDRRRSKVRAAARSWARVGDE